MDFLKSRQHYAGSIGYTLFPYTEKIAAREESAERIADFRDHIESFSAETSRHIAELDADIKTAEDDIKHIDYERYSYEIYEVDEERRIKTDESNLTRIELDQAQFVA